MRIQPQAGEKFGELSPAEQALLSAVENGHEATCGPANNVEDARNNPDASMAWGYERSIRADLIRWLCIDPDIRRCVDPRGINLFAARVLGTLDLSHVSIDFPLVFAQCGFHEHIELRSAQLRSLNFQGSRIRSLSADSARVTGSIFLRGGVRARGQIRLASARIGGNVECDGALIEGTQGEPAFAADGVSISGALFLRNGFCSRGEVRLIGAEIGGGVDFSGSQFINKSGNEPVAINADQVAIKRSLLLNRGFKSEGEVRFPSATVDGTFDCGGAIFSACDCETAGNRRIAFTGDRMVVGRGVFLNAGFESHGEFRLLNAKIGGDLDCGGGCFRSGQGDAADPAGHALSLHNAAIEGNIFLRENFSAIGEIGFAGASAGGNFEVTGAHLEGELNLQSASIKQTLMLYRISGRLFGLHLVNASVDALADDEVSWPERGHLDMDGFQYSRFSGNGTKDAKRRIDWIGRQRGFVPQPYKHLATVLRAEGDERGAQDVLFRMELQRSRQTDLNALQKLSSFAQRVTIGFGYKPTLRAVVCLVVLAFVSAVFFRLGYAKGNVIPTDQEAYEAFAHGRQAPPYYGQFQPIIYSLETCVQVLRMGQADRWEPTGLLRWWRWFEILCGWFFTAAAVAGIAGIVRKS